MATNTGERVGMTSKPKAPGNVNPCGWATIYAGGKPVARCYDTPNARAYAFRIHADATHALTFYPGWAPTRIDRHEWQGSTLTHDQAGYAAL